MMIYVYSSVQNALANLAKKRGKTINNYTKERVKKRYKISTRKKLQNRNDEMRYKHSRMFPEDEVCE